MNRYCVTITPRNNKLIQKQIEVDAHSTSSALYITNLIFLIFGLEYDVMSIRALKPQRYRPVTIWARLKSLLED